MRTIYDRIREIPTLISKATNIVYTVYNITTKINMPNRIPVKILVKIPVPNRIPVN